MSTSTHGRVEHINPDGLNKNPAFTNVITVTGPAKTIYIGGQDSVDASGQVVGKGDIKLQTEQVLKNLQAALKASGADLEHIIKWNILLFKDNLSSLASKYSSRYGDTDLIHPPLRWHSLPAWQILIF